MASPLTDAQRSAFEALLPRRRRLRRHRLGDRDRPVVVVPDRHPRHAVVRPHRGAVGHGQGRRPRPRRDQDAAAVLGPQRPLLQLHRQRPRRLARARYGRRGPVRPAAAGQARSTASPAARWAPTTRSPGARTTRAGARSTPRWATPPPRYDAQLTTHLKGAHRLGRGRRATRSTATAARPCCANYEQTKISLAAEPQRADRLRPAPGRADHPDRAHRHGAPARPGDGHDAGHRRLRRRRPCPLTHAHLHATPRTASTARRSTTTSPPTSGCTCTTRRRRSPTSSSPTGAIVTQTTPNDELARRQRADQDGVGSVGRATSSSRASSSSRTRAARAWTSAPSSRSCACPSTGRSAATSRVTSTSTRTTTCGWSRVTTTPAGGINGGGFGPVQRPADRRAADASVVQARPAGTFTLTFKGQTTAPLPFDATAAQVDSGARGAQHDRRQRRPGHRRPGQRRANDHRVLPARDCSRPTSRR